MENVTIPSQTRAENARHFFETWGPHLPILLLMIIGCVGNLFVVIAVVTFRNLRIIPNYYIASLAVTDLLVSLTSMPFGLYVDINHGEWYLGEGLCKVSIILDVMLSTASILHLCVISRDRLRAITKPVLYAFHRTNKSAATRIFGVYLLSAIVSMPAMIVTSADGDQCGFDDNPVYAVMSSAASFYIPCIVTLTMYFRIYRAATERARRSAIGPAATVTSSRTIQPQEANSPDIEMASTEDHHSSTTGIESDRSAMGNSNPPHGVDYVVKEQEAERNSSNTRHREGVERRVAHEWQGKVSQSRERKATRVIAIVVIVFVSCWLPFFVLHVAASLCSNCQVPRKLYSALTWLGWSNSALNPIIYTIFNKEFRSAFKRIIRGKCRYQRI